MSRKEIYRYPKNVNRKNIKIYFKKGKKIISTNYVSFLKRNEVQGIIKLLSPDFKLINKNQKKLTHFNIQNTSHKVGKNYLITKIEKQGYYKGKTFKSPILNIKKFILVKCLSAQNNVDYVDLKTSVFKNSLSNIKDIDSLKKSIKRRYKISVPYLSDLKMFSLGVAVTKLKIIKRLF